MSDAMGTLSDPVTRQGCLCLQGIALVLSTRAASFCLDYNEPARGRNNNL